MQISVQGTLWVLGKHHVDLAPVTRKLMISTLLTTQRGLRYLVCMCVCFVMHEFMHTYTGITKALKC